MVAPNQPEPYVEGPVGVDERQSQIGVATDVNPAEAEDRLGDLAAELLGLIVERAARGEPREARARDRFSTTLDDQMVNLALTQRGMKENPRGSNNNPYSRYFGYGPQEWCADFVSWCVDQIGNKDRKVLWGYPSAVRNITSWAQRNNLFVAQPHRGSIFTFKNGAHTGMVVEPQGSRFTAIEGNTSGPAPDPAYTWVNSHTRTNDGSYHFIRVLWFP